MASLVVLCAATSAFAQKVDTPTPPPAKESGQAGGAKADARTQGQAKDGEKKGGSNIDTPTPPAARTPTHADKPAADKPAADKPNGDITQCPVMGGAQRPTSERTTAAGGILESELVAEPVEPGHPPPEFAEEQSAGPGFPLRQGIPEARPGSLEEGHQGADDDLAGLVAGRLRPLRPALHPDGLAQRGDLSRPATAGAAPATAPNGSRRSIAGPTTPTSTRPDGCSGRSSRSTATRSPGPTSWS